MGGLHRRKGRSTRGVGGAGGPPAGPTEVRNGGGQQGAANRTVADLQSAGVTATDGGNAPLRATTQVRFRPGETAAATAIQSYLGG